MKDNRKNSNNSHTLCEDPNAEYYYKWKQDPEFDEQWHILEDSADEAEVLSLIFYDRSWKKTEVEDD